MRRLAAVTAWVVLVACFAVTPAAADKRVALVIGNGAYKKAGVLANPTNDSAAMSQFLRGVGFHVIERTNVGIIDLRRAIGELADAARDADIAVVYHSGHGIEVNGINYLIPIDAVLDRDIDVPYEAYSLDNLVQTLEPAKRLRLVMLDACRDNPFVRTMKRTVGTRAVGRGLAAVEPTTVNTLIGFAAKAGSFALDGDGANSPYATSLLHHLATPGLDLRIGFGRVRDDVLKSTKNRQEPFVYGSLGGANVSLVDTALGTSTIPPIQAPVLSLDHAAQVWAVTQNTTSIAVLEDFIRQFGSTSYGSMARARLEELKRAQIAVAASPPPKNAPPATPPATNAAQAWAATKDTTSIAVLEDFIRQFGSTPYGSMARARLQELKKNQIALRNPKSPDKGEVLPPNIFGRWRFTAHCPISGTLTGRLTLSGSVEHLSGTIQQDQPAVKYSISGGHVSGRTMVFTFQVGVLLATWNGTLSGSGGSAQFVGRGSHQLESCSISANRQ